MESWAKTRHYGPCVMGGGWLHPLTHVGLSGIQTVRNVVGGFLQWLSFLLKSVYKLFVKKEKKNDLFVGIHCLCLPMTSQPDCQFHEAERCHLTQHGVCSAWRVVGIRKATDEWRKNKWVSRLGLEYTASDTSGEWPQVSYSFDSPSGQSPRLYLSSTSNQTRLCRVHTLSDTSNLNKQGQTVMLLFVENLRVPLLSTWSCGRHVGCGNHFGGTL